MRPRYTEKEINEVINKFNECFNYAETSLHFNIPISSCRDILNKNGLFPPTRKPLKLEKINGKEIVDKCINLLNEKPYTLCGLCQVVGVKVNTLIRYIKTHNIEGIIEKCSSLGWKSKVVTKEIYEKIIELEKQGLGNDAVGRRLNIDGSTVRTWLIKYYGKEKYKERHSIEKFKTPWFCGFKNKRGDRFHSYLEENVADFLFENNIEYQTQVYLKFGEKSIFPDFYLPKQNIYIEVFGMSEVPFYIEPMNNKIKLYGDNNINMLGIYWKDFKEDKWKEIITKKLINAN